MGMNVGSTGGSGEPEVMMDINTTPLIDVMLVLLIMLIITIPIQLHAVNLDLPTGTPPPQLVQPEIVKIDIDERNRIYFNGETVETMQDVNYRLSEMAKLDRAQQPELHLRPNKLARYEVVAGVMASVQRFGLTKFGIVGAEQFIE
ncbi:MAG TPA: biopolymer transporter ExbD [Methylibium sp.]|nr:biopolymer transporter ExbD [Methylibium sp.]